LPTPIKAPETTTTFPSLLFDIISLEFLSSDRTDARVGAVSVHRALRRMQLLFYHDAHGVIIICPPTVTELGLPSKAARNYAGKHSC
jgi:hypothetical protein